MKATLKRVQGTAFVAKADSNHWVPIDTSPKEDGTGAASGPMEMVLMALGACSAIDVLLMLKKMRAAVENFEIHLDAERAAEPPRVFTKVRMTYVLSGRGLKPSDVGRAIRLSMEKYCSVAGMVGKTASMETSFQIQNGASET